LLRKEMREFPYSKEELLKRIENAPDVWDMRCWEKPKHEYTKVEVAKHIKKWILTNDWIYNCGHAVWCMRKLLRFKWATLGEIAEAVMKNNNIEYPDEIGTWVKS